jgi:hypothetical protein
MSETWEQQKARLNNWAECWETWTKFGQTITKGDAAAIRASLSRHEADARRIIMAEALRHQHFERAEMHRKDWLEERKARDLAEARVAELEASCNTLAEEVNQNALLADANASSVKAEHERADKAERLVAELREALAEWAALADHLNLSTASHRARTHELVTRAKEAEGSPPPMQLLQWEK